MVGYAEDPKGYKLFDPSSQNTFIEMSVHFQEELMQEAKLAHGECSHSLLHEDVSDENIYDFSNSDISEYDDDMHSDHDSPIRPKQAEKTLEAA